MGRYRLDERDLGGSFTDRLNPNLVEPQLNAKLGPERPRPLARETSTGCVYENGRTARRGRVGLPSRFDREYD